MAIMDYRPDSKFSWRLRARCARPGAPNMTPPETSENAVEAALSECRACPVAAECLKEALDRREPFGVWGGMTPTERQSVLSRRARGRKH